MLSERSQPQGPRYTILSKWNVQIGKPKETENGPVAASGWGTGPFGREGGWLLKVKGCLWGSEHILKSIVVMALKTGELCSLSGCTVW